MKLTKLHIDNFRNFREFTILLEKDVNLLVGPNGIGKSTILNLIHGYLNQVYWGGTIHDNDLKDSFIAFEFGGLILTDKLISKLNLESGLREYKSRLNDNYFSMIKEYCNIRYLGNTFYEDLTFPSTLTNLIKNDFSIISVYYPKMGGASIASYIRVNDKLFWTEGATRSQIIDKYFGGKKVLSFNNSAYLDEYIDVLEKKQKTKEKLQQLKLVEAKKINEDASLKKSMIRYRDQFRMQTELVSTRGVEINKLSSGEEQIAKLEAYTKAVLTLNNPISLIDEPELHLSSGQLPYMYETVTQINKKSQLFVATHSENIVRSFPTQNIKYINFQNEKPTYIESETISKIRRHWLIQNPQIFFSKAIIFVEGYADKIFFERALATILKEKNLPDLSSANITVIPTYGKSAIKESVNIAKNILGIKYFVITDSDFINEKGNYSFINKFSIKAISILTKNLLTELPVKSKISISNTEALRILNYFDNIFAKSTISNIDKKFYSDNVRKHFVKIQYPTNIIKLSRFKAICGIMQRDNVWVLRNYKLEKYIKDQFIEHGKVSIDKLQSSFYPLNIRELAELTNYDTINELNLIASSIIKELY